MWVLGSGKKEGFMQLSGSLYLVLAILSSAAMTIVLKIFKTEGHNRYAIILGNYITCIVLGLLLLKDKSLLYKGTLPTYICGGICGILFVVTLVMMQKSIEANGAVMTSAFSKLGLIVPLIMSVVLFKEKPGAFQIAGTLIVLCAMWVINQKKDGGNITAPAVLFIVLLFTGLADGMAKVFDHVGTRDQDSLYILLVFVTALILTVFLFFAEKKRTGKTSQLKDFAAGIAVGVPNYFSSLLLLKSLSAFPAFIVYTVFSTGALMLVSIVGVAFFKEKLQKNHVAGLLMVVIALVLLNVR